MSMFSNHMKKCGIEVAKDRGVPYLASFIINGYGNVFLCSANHAYSRIYARALGKPLIHVIGDSHSWAFKRNRQFIIHNIGPATAFNLANKNSSVRSNEKLFREISRINKGRDIVVMVFGEIDCRVHIYNQFKKNGEAIPISGIIDQTISSYGSVLKQLHDMGINFCVYGVLPASREILRYPPYATARMRKVDLEEFKGRYPYLADLGTRSLINREFNERLKAYCTNNSYKYIDIYAQVADGGGIIRDEYAADEIHVNGKIMPFIKDWFKNAYGLNL